jgi:hypothetical protein
MTGVQHLTVTVTPVGEVRLSASLRPEEKRHGAYLRGLDATGARALAAELLRAADEADRAPCAGPVRPGEETTT